MTSPSAPRGHTLGLGWAKVITGYSIQDVSGEHDAANAHPKEDEVLCPRTYAVPHYLNDHHYADHKDRKEQ